MSKARKKKKPLKILAGSLEVLTLLFSLCSLLFVLPAVVHVVRVAVILGKEVGYGPEIVKVDIVVSISFHRITVNTETHDFNTHLVIIMVAPLDNSVHAVGGLRGNGYCQFFPALEIEPSHVNLIISAEIVLN